MIKKLSLLTIMLVGFTIIISPNADADWSAGGFVWPGGISVGGSIETCIEIQGGGQLDGTTTANVKFESNEAYLILSNPSHYDKTVVVGLGGSVFTTMSNDLGSAEVDDRGKFTVCISGPTTVQECEGTYAEECVNVFNLEGKYALLMYWGIISTGDGYLQEYENLTKNGWDANEVRLVSGQVKSYLTGDFANQKTDTPDEGPSAFIATDEDPREVSWPNPENSFYGFFFPNEPRLLYAGAFNEEQPFAFNDRYSVIAGKNLKINKTQGVLKTDYDLQGDPLEVYMPGDYPTDQGGTVTLNANGSFTYVPPDPLPVPVDGKALDFFTYNNKDNKSNTSEFPGLVVIDLLY